MHEEGYREVTGRLQDGRVVLAEPLAALRAHLAEGRLLVLQSLWPEAQIMALRLAAGAWAERRAPHPDGHSASVPGLSFHRHDDDDPRARMPHTFHQIGLCQSSHGDPALWQQLVAVVAPLLDLQNRLADIHTGLDDPRSRIKIMAHPTGGGYLVRHVHPLERAGVAFFLSLSRPGQDYREGDVYFGLDGADRPAGGHFGIGKAIFFRYDLPHGIAPIDPGQPRDWRAGLWLLSVEPIGAYLQSDAV